MSDEAAILFPGIYPISRCDREVQATAKMLLAQEGLIESVWSTRDRINQVFYNKLTRRIWVQQTNKLSPVLSFKKAVAQLKKHGLDASDCEERSELLAAPHYRAITIDIRSSNVWRRRVQLNRSPRPGDTRVVVHVEPMRPISPQLDAFMASLG